MFPRLQMNSDIGINETHGSLSLHSFVISPGGFVMLDNASEPGQLHQRGNQQVLARHSLPTEAIRSAAFDRLGAIGTVLDADGVIIDTNRAWRLFAHLNDGSSDSTGIGSSYLDVCDRSARDGSSEGALSPTVSSTSSGVGRIERLWTSTSDARSHSLFRSPRMP